MAHELIVTGSREGHPHVVAVLEAWIREHGKPFRLHVGDARGVDRTALGWARGHGIVCEPETAPWDDLDDAAGQMRNEWMVDAAAAGSPCIGFPVGEARGTRGCMRYVLRKRWPVFCVDRHGERTPILDLRDIRLGRRLQMRPKSGNAMRR